MSEFILQIEKLISAFGDAEYRFLMLEPLIFYGLLFGVLMFVCGFFFKAPKLQLAALITIGVAALSHIPYQDARLKAQPRIEQVYQIDSPARVKGFKENTEEWMAASWKFRLLILVTGMAIMIGVNRNRLGFGLGIAAAVLGLFVAKSAMWLHYQDAIAYHPNLKQHEAPLDELGSDERTPAIAENASVSPASAAESYSAPPRRGNGSASPDPLRIPPPETLIVSPKKRQVTPLVP